MDPENHWNTVYKTKGSHELSWTQPYPETSLEFIHQCNLPKDARIIDVGGGDSPLVDHLMEEGFTNITVLDISETALEKAKERLHEKADQVKWITSDITQFNPDEHYDLWHDRATFHFLTTGHQIRKYLDTARSAINGYLVLGTFSDKGPDRCSGLDVRKYSESQLEQQLQNGFSKIRCITEDHITPSDVKQNFLFCSFQRK